MFNTILEYLKHPVTTMIEKSEQEDLKKGAIKAAIISAVMALLKVIITVQSIYSRYSKGKGFYSYYSDEELVEMRSEALKDAELFGTFFKDFLIFAVVIFIFAAILFIIAKIIKSEKNIQKLYL